jgi:anaerobic magnesium-protoporphyrin IX monomethyl ester cyclase
MAEGLRADHVDRKLLKKMHCAGFTSLVFGVESGSNKILQNLKKGETREDIEAAIAAATDLGFIVTLFFLIGSPGEEVGDIKQSFSLARKYNVAEVYFFNLTPIPGTEFYDWAIERGILDGSETRYPERNFGFSKRALLPTDVMTIDQLSVYIRIARRVERQIRFKYAINKTLSTNKMKRLFLKDSSLNPLSWLVSHPLIAPVFMRVWHFAALLYKKCYTTDIHELTKYH